MTYEISDPRGETVVTLIPNGHFTRAKVERVTRGTARRFLFWKRETEDRELLGVFACGKVEAKINRRLNSPASLELQVAGVDPLSLLMDAPA